MSLDYMNYINEFINSQSIYKIAIPNAGIIVESHEVQNIFIRYEILHKEEFQEYFNKEVNFMIKSLPFTKSEFIQSYMEFMSNYEYKNKKSRYAVQLRLLYPKEVVSKQKEKAFIKEYLKQLINVKVELPHLVENIQMKNCKYALITIVERAYIGNIKWKVYISNKWIDTRTGKFASRDCPEQFKKLKCKKGEYCINNKGENIPNDKMYSKNTRLFRYAKDSTGRNMFQEFIMELKVKYTSALLLIFCTKIRKGKVLKKRLNKKTYHNIIKRRIGIINYAKGVVMNITNYLLDQASKSDIYYEPYNPAKNVVIRHSSYYNDVSTIFEKYKARFRKESFHDEDGLERQIHYHYQRVDELENNVRKLLIMFFKDLHDCVNNEEITI